MDSYRSPWLNQTRLTGEFKWLSRESSFRGSLKSFGSPYISLLMIPTFKLLEYTRNAKLVYTILVDDSGFTDPLWSTKLVKASLALRVHSKSLRVGIIDKDI